MTKGLAARLVPLALVVAVSLPLAQRSAHASLRDQDRAWSEQELVRLVNRSRAAEGLGALTVSPRLQRLAREHAARMAASRRVFHNAWLFGAGGRRALGHPRLLGENVGAGGGARAVHDGFMRSRAHRYNVLRSGFARIGVGVTISRGAVWAVEIFTDRSVVEPPAAVGPVPARRTRVDAPPKPARAAPVARAGDAALAGDVAEDAGEAPLQALGAPSAPAQAPTHEAFDLALLLSGLGLLLFSGVRRLFLRGVADAS